MAIPHASLTAADITIEEVASATSDLDLASKVSGFDGVTDLAEDCWSPDEANAIDAAITAARERANLIVAVEGVAGVREVTPTDTGGVHVHVVVTYDGTVETGYEPDTMEMEGQVHDLFVKAGWHFSDAAYDGWSDEETLSGYETWMYTPL